MTSKESGMSGTEQLEFDFVASVTSLASPESRMRKGNQQTLTLTGECPADADWIESSCDRMRNARDLREAVALAACYLADLIDHDIAVRGYGTEWNYDYKSYCIAKYDGYFQKEGQTLGLPGLVWLTARRIFKIYERSNRITDWALFLNLCTCRAMDQEELDGGNSDVVITEFLCSSVWGAYDLLINGGAWIFRTRSSVSDN